MHVNSHPVKAPAYIQGTRLHNVSHGGGGGGNPWNDGGIAIYGTNDLFYYTVSEISIYKSLQFMHCVEKMYQ